MDGKGPLGGVLVVGEAPGAYEDALGEPFVGRSGQLLRQMLSDAGVDPDSVRYTNAVRCRPPTINGKQTKPTPKEIATCREHLNNEIADVSPTLIVVVGDVPLRSVLGKTGIKKHRGQVLDRSGLPVLATYHPAFVAREPTHYATVVSDLRKIKGEESGEVVWEEFLESSPREHQTIAWDVETSYWQDGGNTVIQWAAATEKGLYVSSDVPALGTLSADEWVTHNGWAADVPWMRGMGVEMPRGRDTMVLAYLDDETQALSLESLCTRHLGVPGWKDEGHAAEPGSYEFKTYNARDAAYTLRLYRHLVDVLGLRIRIADHIIAPASLALRACSDRGIVIDGDAAQAAHEYYGGLAARYRAELELWGLDNPNSSPQVAELLVSQGYVLTQKTDSGGLSTDKDVLVALPQTPLVRLLLEYKHAVKRDQTAQIYQRIAADTSGDGRAHGEYTYIRTVTGRTSKRNPNDQQVARDERLRAVHSAPPGYQLVVADYGAIEFRFAAFDADEEGVLARYREDPFWDPHRWFAASLYGEAEEDITDDQRQIAKSANFGLLFKATAETLVDYTLRTTGIRLPLGEARRIRKVWCESLPGFPLWWERVADQIRTTGYSESKTGRRRHFGAPRIVRRSPTFNAFVREGVNFRAQSLAADTGLLGLVGCQREGLPINGFYHDAISAELPDGSVPLGLIVRGMIDYPKQQLKEHFGIDLSVPLTIEVKSKKEKWKVASDGNNSYFEQRAKPVPVLPQGV